MSVALAVTAILLLCVGSRYLQVCVVNGHSMEPTLADGSFGVITVHPFYIDRGDIIVVRLSGAELLVKRVIGIPGDHVIIENGCVYVNSEEAEEEYVAYNSLLEYVDVFVGKDEFFVLGDNRSDSLDSRYFGTINKDAVVGKFHKVL